MLDPWSRAAAARLRWSAPILRSWYAAPDLRAQLRHALAPEIARIDDLDFAADLRGHVDPESAIPLAHWANRWLDLPGGGWLLAGIRFRNRDNARPFVDVIATTADATPGGLAAVLDAVVPAYAAFGPLAVRVTAPRPDELRAAVIGDPHVGPGTAVDRYLVAGLVGELRARPRAAAYERVHLNPGDPAALASATRDAYATLLQENPRSVEWAQPESEDALAECAAAGLLFEIRVDGRPAGVIAATRWDTHGLRGFSVEEVCLDRAHRGHGFAASATQRLLEQVPAEAGDVLWGTIAPGNRPSLHAALRVGRQIVGGTVWVTPPSWPGMPA